MANLGMIAGLAALDGILPVDKPAGVTSHDVVKAVKTRFNLVKVGHGGTLDPNATGLLLLLLGNGTRFSAELMGGDKAYVATLRLGRITDTQDAEGRVLGEKPFSDVTREAFDSALAEFRGDFYQLPPMFSAIKKNGRPLYEIARTGEDAERRERLVHVYRIATREFAPPSVTFEVVCAKGTYVRTIANDVGERLGCGASLDALRRTRCGAFGVEDAIPFMKLMALHPADLAARVVPHPKATGGAR